MTVSGKGSVGEIGLELGHGHDDARAVTPSC